MSIPKVLGIETEYGVTGGPDSDPILASTHLVNALAQAGESRVNWDFGGESPAHDARMIPLLTSVAPLIETQVANTVLSNGARFYVDHAHPEYSSPECRTPMDATLFDHAGELVLREAMSIANNYLAPEDAITVYKNNSDGKGNSYGTHENYLVDRSIEFTELVRALTPHFVSRQVICGAGKVGYETEYMETIRPRFQLAQRSEFFEALVGLETTVKRPIINTRDEPHGDPERFRRLHVIIGDANMSEVGTLVKLGSTALLLAITEDRGSAVFILTQWREMLDGVRDDRTSVADRVDWVAKLRLVDGMRDRHNLAEDDPRLSLIDLQYHDIRPAKSLAHRVGLRRLFTDDQLAGAVATPPLDTRAYFRGRCVSKYPKNVVAANWDSLVFDLGVDPLHRVPMMDPLRGTAALTKDLVDGADSAGALLSALNSL